MKQTSILLAALVVAAAGLAGCGQPAGEEQGEVEPAGGTVAEEYSELQSRSFDVTTELEAQIALFENLGVSAVHVNVNVDNGKVVLSGEVTDPAAVADAENAILDLPGVDAVDNRIAVVSREGSGMDDLSRELADRSLKARVKMALIEALGNAALDLEVSAEDGTVTLSGTLPSESQHQQAVVAAETTQGTETVEDRLEVTG